jgi:hypothetical protein
MDADKFNELLQTQAGSVSHRATDNIWIEGKTSYSSSSSSSNDSDDGSEKIKIPSRPKRTLKLDLDSPRTTVKNSKLSNPPTFGTNGTKQTKTSINVSLLLNQTIRFGFLSNVIYQKEISR